MTAHGTSVPCFLAQTPLLFNGTFEKHKTSRDVKSNSSLLSFWTLIINLYLISHLDIALWSSNGWKKCHWNSSHPYEENKDSHSQCFLQALKSPLNYSYELKAVRGWDKTSQMWWRLERAHSELQMLMSFFFALNLIWRAEDTWQETSEAFWESTCCLTKPPLSKKHLSAQRSSQWEPL